MDILPLTEDQQMWLGLCCQHVGTEGRTREAGLLALQRLFWIQLMLSYKGQAVCTICSKCRRTQSALLRQALTKQESAGWIRPSPPQHNQRTSGKLIP